MRKKILHKALPVYASVVSEINSRWQDGECYYKCGTTGYANSP